MDEKIKAVWVAALRSGKYKQTFGRLHRSKTTRMGPAGYCCLGVLSKACGETNRSMGGRGFPSQNVLWASGIERTTVFFDGEDRSFEFLNDTKRLSFSEIADIIEAQL